MNELTPEAVARIDTVIAAAEARSDAEIVAVLAGRSGSYLHAFTIGGLCGSALAVGGAALVAWVTQGALPVWHVGWFTLLAVGGYVLGLLAARIDSVERMLAGDDIRLAQCTARARQVFVEAGVFRTKQRLGAMLYVSLFEHLVLVLGDETVTAKVGQEDFDAIVREVVAPLRAGEVERALHVGVERLGQLLARHFPRTPGDVNELPDRLLVLP